MAKAPPPESFTRVVRWVVLLFLAYALFSGSFRSHTNSPIPVHTAGAPTDKECATQTSPLENFALVAASVIPTAIPSIRSEDLTVGKGDEAVCGQHATLHYQYALENGETIFDGLKSAEPVKVTIGDETLLRGMELGMIGMKVGGERSITFPPALGFGRVPAMQTLHDYSKFTYSAELLHKSVVVSKVKLTALSPSVPSTTQPIRFIDRHFSSGARVICGDVVSVAMTLWKVDGTKIFSTDDTGNPVTFTVGASQIAYGIEQVVTGMAEDNQRTIIIPAAYAKPLVHSEDANPLATLPNETIVGEVHLLHINPDKR